MNSPSLARCSFLQKIILLVIMNLRLIFVFLWAFVTSVGKVSAACSAEPVRILAIGNSFSADAVETHLAAIFRSQGVEVIIGHLSIGGCSLDYHYDNVQNNRAAYGYSKIFTDGFKTYSEPYTLIEGLKDEPWDYISLQQVSHLSGDYTTYSHLGDLLTYIRSVVGEHPVFVWHQTWAYSTTSSHSGFARYEHDQAVMLRAIITAATAVMREYPEFRVLVPAGTAIQNARQRITAGNELTADGYHLEAVTGRYVAALTWFVAITNRLISNEVYAPDGMDDVTRQAAVDAAHLAVMRPERPAVLVPVL